MPTFMPTFNAALGVQLRTRTAKDLFKALRKAHFSAVLSSSQSVGSNPSVSASGTQP